MSPHSCCEENHVPIGPYSRVRCFQTMAFENATKFFHACESLKGWSVCKEFAEENASFSAQCEPLTSITSVEGYVEWMKGFGLGPTAGCSYDLHSSSYDEKTKTALFFATFNGTHVGEGGPVPPTNKTCHAHYVYALTMNANNKVEKMVKIWNAPWSMKELGWM